MNKLMNRKGGFTLIEILVVIGIIAILAGIVIIAINPSRQFAQARDTQRTSDVSALSNAIGQYIADNKGVLPSEITSTLQEISNSGADICSVLVPTYMAALPVDPSTGNAIPSPCPTSYSTGYKVVEDNTTKRITVSATAETPGASAISITR